MKKLKILIMLFLCLIFTPGVSAKTVNHFYAEAGDDVAFSEEVNGSSALAGQNVESNGKILGVNFLAGNKISHAIWIVRRCGYRCKAYCGWHCRQ